MVAVPSGTVTFLFTDIEGSTRLWETYPHAMSRAHAQHDALTETVITGHDGYLFKRVGDAACATFDRARDALEAALEIQRLLREIAWESGFPGLHVRMALHTGDAELREGDYFGLTLSRVARLLSAGHGGQILLSQVTHQILCDEPPMEVSFDDLGCHRLKDLQRAEGIFQVVHPSLTREFPALRTLDARPNNLPVQLTSFVGREQELAQVAERMATGRLLTLTGAGGTGKTRLALQLAANQVEDYPGGVWFIDLAPVLSPDLVAQTILTTLRLKEDPTRDALDVVMEYLADKAALLLLDNCEHLIDASATVAKKLLQSCNDLRILATSREPLRITGEQVFRIPSLGVPPESAQAEPELAAILPQYEAVRLFMDRALAVQPAFELTSANAPALAQLCIHLDGIPLAIELAAARMRAMTLEQIAARLDNRFRLLTSGDRSALPRQQTLRSLIDWSYDLLSPVEQAMLRRLAVFVGGWTLDAAEQVCAGDPLEEWEILAFLTSLVEKSLVNCLPDDEGEMRYTLLETIRQYALERLEESDDGEAVRKRHYRYFWKIGAMLDWNPSDFTPEQWKLARRCPFERDNARAALAYGFQRPDSVLFFYSFHLPDQELQRYLERYLDIQGFTFTPEFYNAARRLNAIYHQQGNFDAEDALLRQILDMVREANHTECLFRSLKDVTGLAFHRHDTETLHAVIAEMEAIARQTDNAAFQADCMITTGMTYFMMGEFTRAQRIYSEALANLEPHVLLQHRPFLLYSIGHAAFAAGDLVTARTACEEALQHFAAAFRSDDMPQRILGDVARVEQRYADARAHYRRAFANHWDSEHKPVFSLAFDRYAYLAMAAEDDIRATRLLGAGDRIRAEMHLPLAKEQLVEYTPAIILVKERLGEEAFQQAYAEGQAMELAAAIAYCRELE